MPPCLHIKPPRPFVSDFLHHRIIQVHPPPYPARAATIKVRAATIKSHASTVPAHAATIRAHAATIRAHAATIQAHAATTQAHAAIIQAHAATIQAHAATTQAHAAIIQAHAATMQAHDAPSSSSARRAWTTRTSCARCARGISPARKRSSSCRTTPTRTAPRLSQRVLPHASLRIFTPPKRPAHR